MAKKLFYTLYKLYNYYISANYFGPSYPVTLWNKYKGFYRGKKDGGKGKDKGKEGKA